MKFPLDEKYCLYARIRARSPYAAMDDLLGVFGPEAAKFELLYKKRIADQLSAILRPMCPPSGHIQ